MADGLQCLIIDMYNFLSVCLLFTVHACACMCCAVCVSMGVVFYTIKIPKKKPPTSFLLFYPPPANINKKLVINENYDKILNITILEKTQDH